MESLLALAFDNLSSYDSAKVKKGVKQVEGVLASLCLSASSSSFSPSPRPSSSSSNKNRRKNNASTSSVDTSSSSGDLSSSNSSSDNNQYKPLDELSRDPAFREFFKTQEGFQYNIATHLLDTLDRLVARNGGGAEGEGGQYDLLLISVMDLLQGILLLHPPSKKLFSREQNMNLILDLIEPINCPAIQAATLSVLAIALVGCPGNARCFEALDGLLAVTSLHRSRGTSRSVRSRIVEVLYAYLMPEIPSITRAMGARDAAVPGLLQRSPSKSPGVFSFASSTTATGGESGTVSKRKRETESSNALSVEEKADMLSRYMSNVDEFVLEIQSHSPFEGLV